MVVSAGKIGFQIEIDPLVLASLVKAQFYDVKK
jgi:prolyl-tRNA editing enzyme YbaK/EbsC (Cys-tRNA(Pro) deacylase)